MTVYIEFTPFYMFSSLYYVNPLTVVSLTVPFVHYNEDIEYQ